MILDACVSVDYRNKPSALREVAIQIKQGEILGLVGESGSGKSTLALALLRLLGSKSAQVRGHIHFDGRDLLTLPESQMRKVRGREAALILQSPAASLNPALRIGDHFEEAWKAHRSDESSQWKARAFEALELASLRVDESFLRRYPRQISVGQAQRVLIAMAILHRPKLLIGDEPTSALDPIVQSEIRDLLQRLNQELQLSILFISHDLLSVASLCHRVTILRDGELLETRTVDEFFEAPSHPYSRDLIRALPDAIRIPGRVRTSD